MCVCMMWECMGVCAWDVCVCVCVCTCMVCVCVGN